MSVSAAIGKLPPLPTEIDTPVGPIKVVYVDSFTDDDIEGIYSTPGNVGAESTFGMWLPMEREIRIRRGMAPVSEWLTLHHEYTHAIFHDYGIALPPKLEEQLCDTFAHERVWRMLQEVSASLDDRSAYRAD